LGGAGEGALVQRSQQVRQCLDMVAQLEEVRLKADVRGMNFDWGGLADGYARAFRDFGINLEELEEVEASGLVRASAIRNQLVAALDDWIVRGQHPSRARRDRLVALANADDDDAWRNRFRTAVHQKDRPALLAVVDLPEVNKLPPGTLALLASNLSAAGAHPQAVEVLQRAVQRYPDDFWVNHNLALYLDQLRPPRTAESVAYYQAALARRPNSPMVLSNLGSALARLGRRAEAEQCYRKALALQEDFALAHHNLGAFLQQQNKLDEAERLLRRAIQLVPRDSKTHDNLGLVLRGRGRLDEALACFDRSLSLSPGYARAHVNRGSVLLEKGRLDEAAAAYRKAAALEPAMTFAHASLANVYYLQGKKKEAEASFARALKTRPRDPKALPALAAFLMRQKKPREALPFLQEAYRHQPDDPPTASNLAVALAGVGNLAEAERMYRRAVSLKPDYALAWCGLARVLCQRGKFDEALEAARKGHELGRKTPSWPHPSEQWVKINQETVRLDRLCSAYQRGEASPAWPDTLGLARFSHRYKKPHATTASLYALVVAERPDLADEVENGWRYDGACHAVLAAAGKEKGPGPGARERERWRKQALTWLRADLTVWDKRLTDKKPRAREAALGYVGHWLTDADLASVRDLGALAAIPAGEREAWARFWTDATALVARAR
jgi:tetratricopeptide (TPR) repeat protein